MGGYGKKINFLPNNFIDKEVVKETLRLVAGRQHRLRGDQGRPGRCMKVGLITKLFKEAQLIVSRSRGNAVTPESSDNSGSSGSNSTSSGDSSTCSVTSDIDSQASEESSFAEESDLEDDSDDDDDTSVGKKTQKPREKTRAQLEKLNPL